MTSPELTEKQGSKIHVKRKRKIRKSEYLPKQSSLPDYWSNRKPPIKKASATPEPTSNSKRRRTRTFYSKNQPNLNHKTQNNKWVEIAISNSKYNPFNAVELKISTNQKPSHGAELMTPIKSVAFGTPFSETEEKLDKQVIAMYKSESEINNNIIKAEQLLEMLQSSQSETLINTSNLKVNSDTELKTPKTPMSFNVSNYESDSEVRQPISILQKIKTNIKNENENGPESTISQYDINEKYHHLFDFESNDNTKLKLEENNQSWPFHKSSKSKTAFL